MKLLRIAMIFLCCYLWSLQAQAAWIDGISISGGRGKPAGLRGGRIAVIKDWPWIWTSPWGPQITGFWDANFAFWETHSHPSGQKGHIAIFGLVPTVRLQQPMHIGKQNFTPYIEGGIGIAGLSERHLGPRDLGSNWSFQDIAGIGTRFGRQQEFDISLHYLHYSNAQIVPPNNGIDVKILLMLAYRFPQLCK